MVWKWDVNGMEMGCKWYINSMKKNIEEKSSRTEITM